MQDDMTTFYRLREFDLPMLQCKYFILVLSLICAVLPDIKKLLIRIFISMHMNQFFCVCQTVLRDVPIMGYPHDRSKLIISLYIFISLQIKILDI